MDNNLDPKSNDPQDKHQQAQSNLEDLKRVLAEIQIDNMVKPEQKKIRRVELPPQKAVEPEEQSTVHESEPEIDKPKEKKEIFVAKKELPKQEEKDEIEQKTEDAPQETASVTESETQRDIQADQEQLEREMIVNHQKSVDPDQWTERTNPAGVGTKTGVSPVAIKKKSKKHSRSQVAFRRKIQLLRIGTVMVILMIAIVVVVSAVRGVNETDDEPAGSGLEDTSQATDIEESETTTASQQESEQYEAIKDDTSLPSYALEYPGLYADAVSEPNEVSEEKVCYLTFDDGPSSTNTPIILDILKEENVQATFFVVADEIDGCEDILKRIVDEGHTLCIHCNSHEYGHLYQSVEGYLEDFAAAYDKIYEITGYRVQGFRFPGGSNNIVMKRHDTYDAIVTEMTRRGFEYYDWNAYDHDSENGNYTVDQIVNYAVSEVKSSSRNDTILLMHDTYGKETTAQALPTIIAKLKEAGIQIKPITTSTRPVHFEVNENTPCELPVVAEDSDSSAT